MVSIFVQVFLNEKNITFKQCRLPKRHCTGTRKVLELLCVVLCVFSCFSHIQCLTRDGACSTPIFGLYQRPALKSHLISTPVCRWMSTEQTDKRPQRLRVATDIPKPTSRMGNGLANDV